MLIDCKRTGDDDLSVSMEWWIREVGNPNGSEEGGRAREREAIELGKLNLRTSNGHTVVAIEHHNETYYLLFAEECRACAIRYWRQF